MLAENKLCFSTTGRLAENEDEIWNLLRANTQAKIMPTGPLFATSFDFWDKNPAENPLEPRLIPTR